MFTEEIFAFQDFRVEPRARTLRRHEEVVTLNRRAFDVLLYLVQNPGKVVSRDELLQNVWPDTFVDENSVAQSISALRRALQEKPGGKSYIVTLPGRGYQFIVPVQIIVPQTPADELSANLPASRNALSIGPPPAVIPINKQPLSTPTISQEIQPLRLPGSRLRLPVKWLAGLVFAAALVGGFLAWKQIRGKPAVSTLSIAGASPVKARRSVAVLGFRNLSGRQQADWISTALTEMLTTELEAGEKLRLVSGEDVARTRLDLPLAGADSLSRPTLARLHKNLESDLVVLGFYTVLGAEGTSRLRFDLRLQDTQSGETIADVAVVGSEPELFDMVAQAGSRLREKLGIEAVSPAQAVSIQASLPTNAEAARYYAEGLARLRVFDALQARDLLQQAIAADGKYALAHAALADAWSQLGYEKNELAEARLAYKLATDQSREDRLIAEGRFRNTNHEYEQAIDIYRNLSSLFPDDLEYGLALAAVQVRGNKEQAALATVASLRSLPAPASEDPRIDLAQEAALEALGDFQQTVQPLASAVEKAQAWGARLILAKARLRQCWVFPRLGQPQNGVARCREAHEIFAAVGDINGEGEALRNWADALGSIDTAESIRLYQQAQLLFSKVGSARGEATVLNNLGLMYEAEGNLVTAEKMHRQSLAIFRKIEDRRHEAVVTGNVGDDRMQQGDLRGAFHLYEQQRSLTGAADAGSTVTVDYNLAMILQLQGDLAGAKRGYDEALAAWKKSGDEYTSAEAMGNLASLLLASGDLSGAREYYKRALSIHTAAGDKLTTAETQLALADLSLEEGGSAIEQEGIARQALQVFQEQKVRDDEVSAWDTLARSLLAERKENDAKEAIHHALLLATGSQAPDVRWRTSITAAGIEAGGTATKKGLGEIIHQAHTQGYAEIELDARLALAKLALREGHTATGRALLASVQKDASAKGFKLIAGKAAIALA